MHDASTLGIISAEADYVIVGSGAGGSAAARVLARAGRSVIVVEEGPLVTREMVGPVAFQSMKLLMRHAGQTAALGHSAVPILQARCVGGTTFVNSAIIWRLPDKVLARWHKDFGLADGLRAADLDAAYTTIEEEMSVRPVGDHIASLADIKMREGAEKAGIEHRAIRRSESGCKGSGRCFHGCPNDAKQSTTINYLRRAIDDGAEVIANARVERIVVEGGRAVAVTGRIGGSGPHARARFRVSAKRAVIVAASVVQTPTLLRKSGIGLESGQLGEHFTAHPGTSSVGFYPNVVQAWTGAAQGYEAFGLRDSLGVKFETINVPPEIAASRMPGAGPRFAKLVERLPHIAVWAAAVRADGEGSVRPSWLMGGEIVRYSLTTGDVERLRTGLKKLAEMHFLAGATEVLPGVYGLPDVITADQLNLFDSAPLDSRAYSVIATHLFGTCRAARDPAAGVVDENLKVHGVGGLYVMDSSVFPSNTGVNPQHSIMAIATVAAQRLAA